MAMYDNKHWLLSHVKNSFIISDDSGMSEMAMLGEDLAHNLTQVSQFDCYPGVDMSDDDDDLDSMSQSFDIKSDIGFGIHRQRSNTAQHLEKMNQERKRAARIKHIKWESGPGTLTDQERAGLFEKKDLSQRKKVFQSNKKHSLLSEQLENSPNIPPNPFQDYIKYDGNALVGVPTRSYGIFLTMLPEEQRNYPMHVVVQATAKVQDLIGLICWKYTLEHGVNKLKDNVSYYGLYIAEDDGEVDWYFPCLDARETVGKFAFTFLALVELKESVNHESQMEVSETLIPVAPETMPKNKVCNQDVEDSQRMKNHMTAMEAPLYQSYHVYIIHKVRTKTEIHLGISGEKVEIDPVVQQKVSAKFWSRQKAVSYDMDCVAACDLTDTKSSSRATFRLVYHHAPTSDQNHSACYKHYDFEAEHSIADEIVQKINHILELRSSVRRKEYLAQRERKSHRRRSFHLGPR